MGEKELYEIARYDGWEDDAELIDRVQLISVGSVLILRDSAGNDTLCDGEDVVAVISSTPALREIPEAGEARITCAPEIVGWLPSVLAPIFGSGDDDDEYPSALVNGDRWCAFPTADEGFAMLPGHDPHDEPDMKPLWAYFEVQEGEDNPLSGYTSIGVVAPGVAAEYARHDFGGFDGGSAVAISDVVDFAAVFVDWLLNIELLAGLWGGDSSPYSPSAELFETAAKALNRSASWDAEDEDEDDDEDDDEGGNSSWAYLKLNLSDAQIEKVRARLRKHGDRPS